MEILQERQQTSGVVIQGSGPMCKEMRCHLSSFTALHHENKRNLDPI